MKNVPLEVYAHHIQGLVGMKSFCLGFFSLIYDILSLVSCEPQDSYQAYGKNKLNGKTMINIGAAVIEVVLSVGGVVRSIAECAFDMILNCRIVFYGSNIKIYMIINS